MRSSLTYLLTCDNFKSRDASISKEPSCTKQQMRRKWFKSANQSLFTHISQTHSLSKIASFLLITALGRPWWWWWQWSQWWRWWCWWWWRWCWAGRGRASTHLSIFLLTLLSALLLLPPTSVSAKDVFTNHFLVHLDPSHGKPESWLTSFSWDNCCIELLCWFVCLLCKRLFGWIMKDVILTMVFLSGHPSHGKPKSWNM